MLGYFEVLELYEDLIKNQGWRESFVNYEKAVAGMRSETNLDSSPLTLKQCEQLHDILYDQNSSPQYLSWMLGKCVEQNDIATFKSILEFLSNEQLVSVRDTTNTTLLVTIARFKVIDPGFFQIMQQRLNRLEAEDKLNYLNQESDLGTSAFDSCVIANNLELAGYLLESGVEFDQSTYAKNSLGEGLDQFIQRGQVDLLNLIIDKSSIKTEEILQSLTIENFSTAYENAASLRSKIKHNKEFIQSPDFSELESSQQQMCQDKHVELSAQLERLVDLPKKIETKLGERFAHAGSQQVFGKKIIAAHCYHDYRSLLSKKSADVDLKALKELYSEACDLDNHGLKEFCKHEFRQYCKKDLERDIKLRSKFSVWGRHDVSRWTSGPQELVRDFVSSEYAADQEKKKNMLDQLGLAITKPNGPKFTQR